jgi:hypothetical protein
MSVSSGPNVVSTGLVFDLDAGNRKSWGGIGNERVGTCLPTWSPWSGLTGSSVAYDNAGVPGVHLITQVGGGVNWWTPSAGGLPCTPSTQYVITAKVKYVGSYQAPHPNLFYVRQYNAGGAQTSEGGRYNSAQMIPIGNDYYLAWAYFTTDSTATSFYVHGYEYSGSMNIWLEDVQCKLSGLADVSGYQHDCALVNGPAYDMANGGSFIFDGVDDYAFASNAGITHGTSNFAYSMWANWNGKPGLGTLFENGIWGGSLLIRFESSAITIYSMSGYRGAFSFNPTLGTWYNVTFVRSGNTILFYVNGEYSASIAFDVNIIPSSGYIYIGTSQHSITQCFNGKISVATIHNQALSAAQVTQNFNALRGRYGI